MELTSSEIKLYKDIKKDFKLNNIKDDDKVVVEHFKILDVFDNLLNNK